jgi:hypothetical protein
MLPVHLTACCAASCCNDRSNAPPLAAANVACIAPEGSTSSAAADNPAQLYPC